MNRDKHIWEGWTVGDFIDEIEPSFNIINSDRSMFGQPNTTINTRQKLKEWVKSNQPYYKKHIPEVYNYFLSKTNL